MCQPRRHFEMPMDGKLTHAEDRDKARGAGIGKIRHLPPQEHEHDASQENRGGVISRDIRRVGRPARTSRISPPPMPVSTPIITATGAGRSSSSTLPAAVTANKAAPSASRYSSPGAALRNTGLIQNFARALAHATPT